MMRQRNANNNLSANIESSENNNNKQSNNGKFTNNQHAIVKSSIVIVIKKQTLYYFSLILFVFIVLYYAYRDSGRLVFSASWFGAHPNNNDIQKNDYEKMMQQPKRRTRIISKSVCPSSHRKRFFISDKTGRINVHVVRALNFKGWQQVYSPLKAQLIWSKAVELSIFQNLKKWQRYNHHRHAIQWEDKALFTFNMMQHHHHQLQTRSEPIYIPETYVLSNQQQHRVFLNLLENGMNVPWVLKRSNLNGNMGIRIFGPNNNKQLKTIIKKMDPSKSHVIQRYICNEMTFHGRKMDFRVFWMIASLDPLIVLYHDGYLRIGNNKYSEQNFNNTRSHLTTNSNDKASWKEFEQLVVDAHAKLSKDSIPLFGMKKNDNPMMHVRNQVKHSLAQMVTVFANKSMNINNLGAENGYGVYGADFIIDNDLDVWFIEPQLGPTIIETTMLVQDLNNIIFVEMAGIVDEIIRKQEAGLPLLPLKEQVHFETIYNDGWSFEYEGYQRSKNKKPCQIATRPTALKENN